MTSLIVSLVALTVALVATIRERRARSAERIDFPLDQLRGLKRAMEVQVHANGVNDWAEYQYDESDRG